MTLIPNYLSLMIASLLPVDGSTPLDDDSDRGARQLDQIQVTATRREQSSLDVSQAVTVVTSEEMAERNPQTVMDLLRGEVGAYVQQTTPGQGVVIVRGLKGSEVLHLVDGFRLNNAFFRNAPNQYISLVDGQALDRIEVLRGPSSTLYGGDAMGGTVQMLTPDPRFSGSQFQTRGRVRSIYDSGDRSLLTRASASGGRDGFGVSMGVTYQDVNERRVGGGERLPFTAFRSQAGDVKLLWQPAEGHELVFQGQYASQPSTPRYDALVPGFGQSQPDSALFQFEPQERYFGQAIYRFRGVNPLFDQATVQLGRQIIIDNRRSVAFASNNLDQERNRSSLNGLIAQFGKAVGMDHYLSYGMEFYRDTVNSFRQRTNIATGVVSPRAPRFPDGSSMDSLGAYLLHDWQASDRMSINTGLRYSRIDVDLTPIADGPAVRVQPDDLSGQVGFNYAISPELHMVANLGRGFRPANVFDLGTFGDRPGNRFNIPNADIKPEVVESLDFGFKYSGGPVSTEVIGFVSRYKDKITSVLTGELTETGAQVVQSRNATRLDLRGVEAGARIWLSDKLEVYSTLTFSRGEERLDGDRYPADRIPPLFGSLGARYELSQNWSMEGYSYFARAQNRLSPRDRVDARINPNGTAGWNTLNLRTSWTPSPQWRLGLSLENLSDRRYREHGSGIDQMGRRAVFSVEYTPGS